MQHDWQVTDHLLSHHPESETGHREGLDAIEAWFPEVSPLEYQESLRDSLKGREARQSDGINARDGSILTNITTQISTPPPDRDIDLEEADEGHVVVHVSTHTLAVTVEQDALNKQNARSEIRTPAPDASPQSLGHSQDLHDAVYSPMSDLSPLSSSIDLSSSLSELRTSTVDGLLTPRSPTDAQDETKFDPVQDETQQDMGPDQVAVHEQLPTGAKPSRKRKREASTEPNTGYTMRITRARTTRNATPGSATAGEPVAPPAESHIKINPEIRKVTMHDPNASFWKEVDALRADGQRSTRAQHRTVVAQTEAGAEKPKRTRRRK